MNNERPVMELGLGTLALAVGISAVIWWGLVLLVRWSFSI